MKFANHGVAGGNESELSALACYRRLCGRGYLATLSVLGVILSGCVTEQEPAPATYTQYVASPPPPPEPPAYNPGPAPAPVEYQVPLPPPPAANPLDQLMGPVALYPDPLISILLPASTFPNDIQSAGAYLSEGGDTGQVDGQPWDASVRGLAHYPEVVKWMAQNLPWTQAVGAAFVSQPAEVMESIQRLRELARAAGTLRSSPQQQVIVESAYVEIEPAQPGIIYVPQYDPQVVYVDQPYYGYNGPFCTYGPAYQGGVWLTFGADWRGRGVVVVDSQYWHDDRGWRRDPYAVRVDISISERPQPWHYPQGRPHPVAPPNWRQNTRIVNAHPVTGAPPRPPEAAYRDIHTRGPAAVTVVSRDPGAFKGRPLNPAILPHASGPAPGRPAPIQRRPETAPRVGTTGSPSGQNHPENTAPRIVPPAQTRPEATAPNVPYQGGAEGFAAGRSTGGAPLTRPEMARPPTSPVRPAPIAPKPEEHRVEPAGRPNVEAPHGTVPAEKREIVRPKDDKATDRKDPKKPANPGPDKREPEKRPDDTQH